MVNQDEIHSQQNNQLFNFICNDLERQSLERIKSSYKLSASQSAIISTEFDLTYKYNFSCHESSNNAVTYILRNREIFNSTKNIFSERPIKAFCFLYLIANLNPQLLRSFLDDHNSKILKSQKPRFYIYFNNLVYHSKIEDLLSIINSYESDPSSYIAAVSYKNDLSKKISNSRIITLKSMTKEIKFSTLRSVEVSQREFSSSIGSPSYYESLYYIMGKGH